MLKIRSCNTEHQPTEIVNTSPWLLWLLIEDCSVAYFVEFSSFKLLWSFSLNKSAFLIHWKLQKCYVAQRRLKERKSLHVSSERHA